MAINIAWKTPDIRSLCVVLTERRVDDLVDDFGPDTKGRGLLPVRLITWYPFFVFFERSSFACDLLLGELLLRELRLLSLLSNFLSELLLCVVGPLLLCSTIV